MASSAGPAASTPHDRSPLSDPHELDPRLSALRRPKRWQQPSAIIEQVQPDEIYNLGAQSHVAVSFEAPEYTANVDAIGPLRILEAA